jgi:hypothetical protein
MTGTRSPRLDDDLPPGARPVGPPASAWTGWIAFGAFMMFLLGFFQAIAGLAAIVNDDFYEVTSADLLVVSSYTAWGWTHLVLGVVVFASGVGVLSGNTLARGVGVVVAMLSMLLSLAFAPAQPVWSLIKIVVAALVIYALIVHGREMRNTW